ncbi:ABC transporter permease [Hyphomicrobium sp. CS1BSMeth3]|uniref:ABC transporter permease n=1 Tax=Hyphomicrobium sp. CS1BSMeth3 TaxID=1892844 RepID=UPI0015773049|nr:ABC transporter permease [Hyphomicrobium sp. CS1BSMeth3]
MSSIALVEYRRLASARVFRRLASFGLLLPALLLLFLFFFIPIGYILFNSVNNSEVRTAFPRASVEAARIVTGKPAHPAFYDALAEDFSTLKDTRALGEAARRLNYEVVGYRTVVLKTGRTFGSRPAGRGDNAARFAEIDERWTQPDFIAGFTRATRLLTPYYFLRALDMREDDSGDVVRVGEDVRVFVATLLRTLEISGSVTILCLLIGYPLAGCLVILPRGLSALLLFSVLVPFWTSILVRTSSWIVVLSKEGIINSTLLKLGIITEPMQLVFNRTGLYITMVHVMLPFMVLPIYSVMRSVPKTYLRASLSLGAHPILGFWKVFVPLTMPGIASGCLMTFIITVGYYITPTLVGGPKENMITYFIAFFVNDTINWGMAAALGTMLLGIVMALYFTIGKVVGIHRIVGLK